MSQSHLSVERVKARVHALLQGLTTHPELGKGLPTSAEEVKKAFDGIVGLSTAQGALKKGLKLATEDLQIALRATSEMVRATMAVAAMIHNPNSDAVVQLGGKPRRGGRPKEVKTEAKGEASPDAVAKAA